MGKRRGHRNTARRLGLALAIAAAAALVPAGALAHIERASYWPDPAPDTSVSPPTGGAVPTYRGLFTALDSSPPGRTRVVCQGRAPRRPTRQLKRARANLEGAALRRRVRRLKGAYNRRVNGNPSIKRLRAGLAAARANGFSYRPRGERIAVGAKQAASLLAFNKRLLAHCRFDSIQSAVTASHNNDRVVVMPGIYSEPESRAAPTNDPRCDGLEEQNDKGSTAALSYEYQLKCPNDQNLVAVLGRAAGGGTNPQPPLLERRGIPNLGPCIRCNLQIEGSGISADDVVVDAGRVASGDGGPAEPVKDVVIRADRADGFVLANVTVRHAAEHGVYVLESDGYLLDRFKAFYNEEYGVLTFVEDHGRMSRCEAKGSGDSGLYPGAAAETGRQTVEPRQRYNQEIVGCDSHHNASGYSGTAANGVWVHHNDFYDNALGFTTDVFTAAGHPGFPQDSDLVENNDFFDNNFNPYVEGSDVVPTVPVPVGTGMWIAGGNANIVRNNRFWDNWRRGTMLFAVPDALVCGPGTDNEQAGCDPGSLSTSYDNQYYGNVMGVAPDGSPDPNGEDFWWDGFVGNTGNCWHDNTGSDGTEAGITSTPPAPLLPSDCETSVGTGGPAQEAELVGCLGSIEFDADACPWFATPAEPQP